ncbi:hypothetical protein ALC62_07890 [Cyphomyrmex costatus]|uniref:Uncharacterized protein n=1 Tax=Cyphomyrmex costatus TaxID=456900 RepID=A0A195CKM3_9HYME|nr:hypothetical protein ALC62_07890 [Cyphomyrmex costatus]
MAGKSTLAGLDFILRKNSPRTVSVTFFISSVGSSNILNNPSSISGPCWAPRPARISMILQTICQMGSLYKYAHATENFSATFINLSSNSVAFFIFCSVSQASLLRAAKMSVN